MLVLSLPGFIASCFVHRVRGERYCVESIFKHLE